MLSSYNPVIRGDLENRIDRDNPNYQNNANKSL